MTAAEATPIDTARLAEALDCLGVALAIFDPADRLVYANQHLVRIFPSTGPDAGALTGLSFCDIVMRKLQNGEIGGQGAIQDPEAWLDYRLSFHRSSSVHPLVMQLSDGRWIEAGERSTPDGGIVVHWTDVSERRRGQLQLEDTILSVTDGYALWDAAGRLTMCNRRFADLLCGDSAMQLIGLRLADVLGRGIENRRFEIGGAVDRWLEDRVAEHRKPRSDALVETVDRRWLRMSSRRTRDGGTTTVLSDITDEHERELGFINRGKMLDETSGQLNVQNRELARKTSELRRARDLAAMADASRTAFLRNMSHELRTPLNSIIGFAEVLKKELYGPLGSERYDECAGMVLSSGQHLLNLINRILDLSRLETGRYTLSPEPVNLGHLVEESIAMMERSAEAKGVTVEFAENARLPDLLVDETAIRQVVLNLLSNAIKFSRRDGAVRLTVDAADGGAVLSVADNGIGIEPDQIERVMQPFEQVYAEDVENRDGVGLGLPIAKSLVHLHGGTITLDSAKGQGTRVDIWLPRADLVKNAIAS